jgi:LPXTG-site transpeptidase (sortase) family protein
VGEVWLPPRAAPRTLTIPTLGLEAPFGPSLGIASDQTVEVPTGYTEVGWYRYSAEPGMAGTAVVLGHVDSRAGPGVFYSLGQLVVGDEILITRATGEVVRYQVYELTRYPRAEFPTERVYGQGSESELRLVTCSGTFSRGRQEYTHNLVVYARQAGN